MGGFGRERLTSEADRTIGEGSTQPLISKDHIAKLFAWRTPYLRIHLGACVLRHQYGRNLAKNVRCGAGREHYHFCQPYRPRCVAQTFFGQPEIVVQRHRFSTNGRRINSSLTLEQSDFTGGEDVYCPQDENL